MGAAAKALHAVLAGIGLVSAASAQQPERPELDFLEYLGSWQESDEEWEIVAEWEEENMDSKPDAPEREDEDNE